MKSFGHKRPVRDAAGEITGSKDAPVRARTVEPLGGAFGPDRAKRLIVSLERGDQIVIRPERTGRKLQAAAVDIYRWLVRNEASRALLEKARAAKERKATRLADLRAKRATRRLMKGDE